MTKIIGHSLTKVFKHGLILSLCVYNLVSYVPKHHNEEISHITNKNILRTTSLGVKRVAIEQGYKKAYPAY